MQWTLVLGLSWPSSYEPGIPPTYIMPALETIFKLDSEDVFCFKELVSQSKISQTGPPRRVDCLARKEEQRKCFSRKHNNKIPDSSTEPATFRLPAVVLN